MPRTGNELQKCYICQSYLQTEYYTCVYVQIGCGFFIWEDMYLWVIERGRPKRGKKMQVWVLIVVCVAIIWLFFKSTEEEGDAKGLCKCAK